MIWPSKDEREEYEIKGFIENYKKLLKGRKFIILEKKKNLITSLKIKKQMKFLVLN